MPTLSPAADTGTRCGSVVTLAVGRQHARDGASSRAPGTSEAGTHHAEPGAGDDVGADRPPVFDVADAYDAHAGELFGFALNALRDRSGAEECVQEAFLRAWRARDRYDPARSSVRTWLFAIIRNLVRDRQRSAARAPLTVGTDELGDTAGEQGDPSERLAVLEALATLSRDQRAAVVAIHLVGMSYAELSGSTGVPVATLRTRTFYALRALRRHFEEGGAR